MNKIRAETYIPIKPIVTQKLTNTIVTQTNNSKNAFLEKIGDELEFNNLN